MIKLMKVSTILISAFITAGCNTQTTFKDHRPTIDPTDKKYNTKECKELREEMVKYRFYSSVPFNRTQSMIAEDNERSAYVTKLHQACLSYSITNS